MLIDNRNILLKKHSYIYSKLAEIESGDYQTIELESTKNNLETIAIKNGNKKNYLHSKYDPLKETSIFLQQFNKLSDVQHVLFIGAGLGYHIIEILNENPNLKFSIFEPNIEVLDAFLNRVDLKRYREERVIEIFSNDSDIQNKPRFLSLYAESTTEIIWSVTNQIYFEEIEEFRKGIIEPLKQKVADRRTSASLQQRWTINSIVNFPKLLNTPNLLLDIDISVFENKPVVIVSAGPSLAEDIEYIRQIKNEGRAYIFAVGSAINALIAYDIMPDAFFSVDPNPGNAKVVAKLKEKNLKIPLVFGSSIGFEVLENYPGPKIHFMLNEDRISKHLINYPEEIVVYDAVSVANMTLQAIAKLKMNPVVLAGQNLAYLNDRIYSKGIDYEHRKSEISEKEKESAEYTQSVTGETITTSLEMLRMKSNMESILTQNPQLQVFNTTKNGAKIGGTEFLNINKVIETKLIHKQIVSKNWFDAQPNYEIEKIKEKYIEFENSFDELLKLFERSIKFLDDIQLIKKNGQFKNLEIQLSGFDVIFNLIQENEFFKEVVQPMSRVQHEAFVIRSPEVAQAKTSIKKIGLFDEIFGYYLKTMYAQILYIQPAFGMMKSQSDFWRKSLSD